MKRFDPRIIFGSLLIFGGGLMLLQTLGYLQDAGDLFWGAIFLAAGVAFLFTMASGQWWASIPGFVLAGIGIIILLPNSLEDFGGGVFLGMIGLGFWMVYLTDRSRWWAMIPGGVLVTLAAVATVSQFVDDGFSSGAILFLGMSLTFLLVALFADMSWAYWPAGVMAVMGMLLFMPSQLALGSYVGAFAMIAVGGYFIWKFFKKE